MGMALYTFCQEHSLLHVLYRSIDEQLIALYPEDGHITLNIQAFCVYNSKHISTLAGTPM